MSRYALPFVLSCVFVTAVIQSAFAQDVIVKNETTDSWIWATARIPSNGIGGAWCIDPGTERSRGFRGSIVTPVSMEMTKRKGCGHPLWMPMKDLPTHTVAGDRATSIVVTGSNGRYNFSVSSVRY